MFAFQPHHTTDSPDQNMREKVVEKASHGYVFLHRGIFWIL
jgi:hypothetical protein